MLNPVRPGQKWLSTPKAIGFCVIAAGFSLANAAPTDSAKVAPTTAEKPAPAVTSEPTTAPVVEAKKEVLDTTSDEQVSRNMTAAADSSAAKTAQQDSAKVAAAALKEPTVLENLKLSKFKAGGILRTVVSTRDLSAEDDAAKTATMGVDLARLSFSGQFETGYGFGAELDFAKSGGAMGLGQVYMQWQKGPFDQIRAGRIKRMFSHEAILSDNQLPFNFRGSLYQDFLNKTTGYTGYEVGVNLSSGWEDAGIPVHYQLGIYNGRRADTSSRAYTVDAWKDADLKAKDLAFHIDAQVHPTLLLEAGLTTKTTEDKSTASNFDLAINTAYQLGAFFSHKNVRVNGEIAYGDNHKGRDALIVDGSSNFLGFYLEGLVRHTYASSRWSELLLKLEGLDPDMGLGDEDGKPNDGKFRYSLGGSYGLNADNSLTLVWGFLHPITESKVTADSRLRHDVDLYWKMAF
jgi:Phosphate-selective porin O and P